MWWSDHDVRLKLRRLVGSMGVVAAIGVLAACASVVPKPASTVNGNTAAVLPPISTATVVDVELAAPAFAPDKIKVEIHLPPGYAPASATRYPVLYINDGQDMTAVGLGPTLARLYEEDAIGKIIVVAIHMLPDRMGTYGLSDRAKQRSVAGDSRFGPVGARAHAYSDWIARELVPYVDANYRTRTASASRVVLGWSLGALNAFNLGWQYPEVFGAVGAFSPSFWLAADRSDAASVQRTRLAQRMVDAGPKRDGLRLWFAVGSTEETDDRDSDGTIDAVDDVQDLIEGFRGGDGVLRAKGLRQLGYSVNADYARHPSREEDVAFFMLDSGQHNQASWQRMLPAFLTWAFGSTEPGYGVTGTIENYESFPSRHVDARKVQVWLPPSYAQNSATRYPVVYMQDGQNLFDPKLSYAGVDWGVDETMTRLIAEGGARAAIVVGIWNTPQRLAEYMPQKAVTRAEISFLDGMPPLKREELLGDAYLRFLVDELKPFIDRRYRTLPGRDDTVIMGSSMGGLVSLYAISEYPDVFGGAGAISTHWPAGDGVAIDWFARHLPDPRTHRIYFDFGTQTLDAGYETYQCRMDAAMAGAGYREGKNWMTKKFVGAEHSERAWRRRVHIPLGFLLGR